MKRNIFIFHGTGGYPGENWFPWAKRELEKLGHSVYVPQFPNADKPLLDPWLKKLDEYKQHINEDTIFIAHSLGGLFLLRVLERLEKPVRAAVFVAPSAGVQPIKFYQGDFEFSNGFEFDWNIIRSNARDFVVFHSDNDPYIDRANGELVAQELGVDLIFIPNAGHFNMAAGYIRFDRLLQEVKRFL